MRVRGWSAVCLLFTPLAVATSPATAQTPRELLLHAAFEDRSREAALAKVDRARALALAASARFPSDQESAVLAATAQGYRAKLTGNRGEAMAAKRQFDAVAARFPRNPEALLGLGAWHLGILNRAGALLGRVVGARRSVAISCLDRSVAQGGDRAMFPGLAGMMLIEANGKDSHGRELVERAVRSATPTPLDRIVQRAAVQVAAALRRGDTKAATALADRLAPFGWHQPE